jgi:hypothetical protein
MLSTKILHKLTDKLQMVMSAVEDGNHEDAIREGSAFFMECTDYLSVAEITTLIREIADSLRLMVRASQRGAQVHNDAPKNTGGG